MEITYRLDHAELFIYDGYTLQQYVQQVWWTPSELLPTLQTFFRLHGLYTVRTERWVLLYLHSKGGWRCCRGCPIRPLPMRTQAQRCARSGKVVANSTGPCRSSSHCTCVCGPFAFPSRLPAALCAASGAHGVRCTTSAKLNTPSAT